MKKGSPAETQELYAQLSELNNRLVTAQRELAKSNAELKQLLADRAKIAAMAGHDLRSPLQVITSAGGVPPVLGDPVRLEQVFDNLLHNAIKYSPQAGTIKVDVAAQGEEVTVAVENEGGLTRDKLDRILAGEFERSEAGTQSERGFGLGFSIMKTIVEKHRGTIQGDSEGGQAVRFSIHLPACDRSAVAN